MASCESPFNPHSSYSATRSASVMIANVCETVLVFEFAFVTQIFFNLIETSYEHRGIIILRYLVTLTPTWCVSQRHPCHLSGSRLCCSISGGLVSGTDTLQGNGSILTCLFLAVFKRLPAVSPRFVIGTSTSISLNVTSLSVPCSAENATAGLCQLNPLTIVRLTHMSQA